MAAKIGFIGTTSVLPDWSEQAAKHCSLHIDRYIATMRCLLALTMILSLLSVTAMPVQAEAPVCKYAMQTASGCDSCHRAVAGTAVQAADHHHARLDAAARHCRIECGCGCHRDIDGLPHTPDAFSPVQAGLTMVTLSLHAPQLTPHPFFLQVFRLQRPPPRGLS
jgi:hypothetical protein